MHRPPTTARRALAAFALLASVAATGHVADARTRAPRTTVGSTSTRIVLRVGTRCAESTVVLRQGRQSLVYP